MKSKSIMNNVLFAIASNAVVLLSSTLTLLIIPNFLSVADYGYVQMYIFYVGYLGIMHIGWIDGIYLKLGGLTYQELTTHHLFSQYKLFKKYIIIATLACVVLTLLFVNPIEKKLVFFFVSLAIYPCLKRQFFDNLLLISGEMKLYAKSCFFDRGLYLLGVGCLVVFKVDNVLYYMFADLLARFVGFLISRNTCSDIWRMNDGHNKKDRNQDAADYIKSGINLLIGNFSSMLIVGSFRMAIEYNWDIITYSQMSLTLNVANFILGFINAVSQVFFTILKRSAEDQRVILYKLLRIGLTVIIFGGFILYVPMKELLVTILPKYAFGLKYMAILLPLCFIECKWSFLTLTYLKAEREERNILRLNVTTLFIALLLAFITCFMMRSLFATVFSIVIVLLIRSIVGELIICKKLKLMLNKNIIEEVFVIFLFILFNWWFPASLAIIMYACIYIIYLLLERKSIILLIKCIRYHTLLQ